MVIPSNQIGLSSINSVVLSKKPDKAKKIIFNVKISSVKRRTLWENPHFIILMVEILSQAK